MGRIARVDAEFFLLAGKKLDDLAGQFTALARKLSGEVPVIRIDGIRQADRAIEILSKLTTGATAELQRVRSLENTPPPE